MFLCALSAAGSWSQTDVGYINGSIFKVPASEKNESAFKRHFYLSHKTRTNNSNLGFRLSKDSKKTINLVPLVDLGIQYNTSLNGLIHRNGMGFLLEARPIKKSYVRIGGLVNISNTESLNPGNINLIDIGASQKLWIMPMTRLAYTPNEVFCFQAGYDRNFI